MRRVPSLSQTLLLKVTLAVVLSTVSLGYLWVSSEYGRSVQMAEDLRDRLFEERQQGLQEAVVNVLEYVEYMRSQARQRAMHVVRSQVEQAHEVASHLYQQYRGSLAPEDIQDLVREALRDIRFNDGRGYYFATRSDGVEMLFADRPELEGKNLLDMKDSHGKFVIRDMIAIARDPGEGFYEYTWTKPGGEGTEFQKISYVKQFEPFDWFIGTGEYLDDIEAAIQREVLGRIADIKVDLVEADGYIFVGQWDGQILGHPAAGKNLWNLQDPNGVYIVRRLIEGAREGSAFIEYVMPKLGGERPFPKLSYVAGVPEWQWFLGTGAYLDDIETAYLTARAENRQRVVGNLGKILVSSLIVLGAGLLLALWSVRRTRKELQTFAEFFRSAKSAGEHLPLDSLNFREFRELAATANEMVAERSQVLRRLGANEERMELATAAAGVGLWDWNMKNGDVYFSPTYCRMLGYEPEELEGSYETWFNLMHPDDRAPCVQRLQADLDSPEKAWNLLFRMRHKDGDYRWIVGKGRVVEYDRDNSPSRATGTHVDISDRLLEEARFRALAAAAPWGLFTYRLEEGGVLVFTSANATADTILDVNCQQFVGLTIEEAFPPLAETELPDAFRVVAKQGGTWSSEQVDYRDDEISGAYDVRAFQISPGEVAVAFSDITEAKRAKEALETSERKYRELFEKLVDVAYRTDVKGLVEAFSPSVLQVLGYEPEQCIGLPASQFYRDPSQRDLLMHQLKNQGRVSNFEIELVRADGSSAWVSLSAREIVDDTGRFKGVEGVMRDVTELKQAQEEREVLEIQLRQAQKMEAIGTLAGGIAHDFNNVLAAILGYGELCQERLPKETREHGYVTEMVMAATRARELVKQILAFSRREDKELTAVRVSLVVAEAAKLLRASVPTTVEIREQIDPDTGQVLADPTQIHQIVMNLCTNAYQSMRESGGVMGLTLQAMDVGPALAAQVPDLFEGRFARLRVSDTGVGMDPPTLARAFDPFFTTKQVGEGTGMGLAVVHGIVRAHNGAIAVHSVLGEGTRVDVYLPIVTDAETEVPSELAQMSRGAGQRILLVDDEEMLVNLLEQMLSRLGYSVSATSDPHEALRWFQEAPDTFDATLTDQTMPGLTGAALTKEMLQIRPEFPVIICTGYSDVLDEAQAVALGARSLLMKPFNRARLAVALEFLHDQ